ncbi:hypothetical protein [Corticimicrobacter populi]|uniref:Arc-like DNA binding domain-containing protein n=1 Tax=Corticimicrobacter populi TaxID=2175229 RepID=A0A2V1K454_9BURK|nr:hypothetical protein [Corticimicrobacter populi]PWF25023.1 hypothetical protein DD235_02295 [Corticimicrobacter populi]
MTDKYEALRKALPELVEEARRQGGTNPRAQMIIDLLADHDALNADNERLRVALRWTAATLQDATASLDLVFEEDQITINSETKTVAQILDAADAALVLTKGELDAS